MATKPCDLYSIPGIQMMEREPTPQFVLWSPRMCMCAHTIPLLKKESTYETQGRCRITQTHGWMKCLCKVSLACYYLYLSFMIFYYWFAYKVTILGNLSLLFSPQPWYFCFVVFQKENHHSVQIMTLISKLKKNFWANRVFHCNLVSNVSTTPLRILSTL